MLGLLCQKPWPRARQPLKFSWLVPIAVEDMLGRESLGIPVSSKKSAPAIVQGRM